MKTFLCILLLCFSTAFAQTFPALSNYQGRLTDANGIAAPDGTGYEIELRLWSTATGGTAPVWAARYTGVALRNGAFNLLLGAPSGVAIAGAQTTDLKAAVANSNLFLGMTVTKGATGSVIANPAEILPRQQWIAAPFALRAEVAVGTLPGAVTSAMISDGGIATADIANDAITNAKIATGAVNADSIAANAITSSHITAGSINPDRLNAIYAFYYHEVPSGTSVASVVGWQDRTLNAGTNSADGSIARTNSTITLQPGTYQIDASSFVYSANGHNLILRDVTSGAAGDPTAAQAVLRGPGGHTPQLSSGNSPVSSNLISCEGYVTVSGSAKQFELWHYITSASSGGFGSAAAGGGIAYRPLTVRITRIK